MIEPADYVIRRLTPADAAGVAACVRGVYGDSYIIHTELYHPEEIVALNQSGRLVSVVALDAAGRVVGHYALERPDPEGRAAESGEAMVLPEHQHHHLLERMRVRLEEEGQRLGLSGIFGRTVTNHVYSQKAVERFGERPCGVSLGRTPKSFRNMDVDLPQRMSIIFYFKYLRRPERLTLHVPDRHRALCERVYAQLDVPVTFSEPEPLAGRGRLDAAYEATLGRASLRARRVGTDTADAVAKARAQAARAGAEVVFLDLPLSQPATPAACAAAEAEGFFFCGFGPEYLPEGDALRMQWLGVPIDPSLLQIENPFARELLVYVEGQRQRVARG